MLRLGQGDDLALNELMERWQQPLVRYIYRYVGSRATALDLAQETFVRIFRQRHRFKEKLRFSAWLFTIALNLCRSSHRWQSRHQTVALENEQEQEGWETESGLLTSNSPADDASRKELAIVVRSAVQTLPDKLKTVVLLADYEEYHTMRLPRFSAAARRPLKLAFIAHTGYCAASYATFLFRL